MPQSGECLKAEEVKNLQAFINSRNNNADKRRALLQFAIFT